MENSITPFQKQIFSTAMLINLSGNFLGLKSAEATDFTKKAINAALADNYIKSDIGEWSLVWGPVVYVSEFIVWKVPQNSMCIYYNKLKKTYLVAIAGTVGKSIPTWFKEDFAFHPMKNLPFNNTGDSTVKISYGALDGFNILTGMKDSVHNKTIEEYLNNNVKAGDNLYVCGHSLGGTLASVVALYLKNTIANPDNIFCMPVASLTSGNGAYASYYNQSFPPPYNLRIWNTVDVAPHLFQRSMLQELPDIYPSKIHYTIIERAVIDYFKIRTLEIDFTQIESFYSFTFPIITPADFNPPSTDANTTWSEQIVRQHVASYGYTLCNAMFRDNVTKVFNEVVKDLGAGTPITGAFFTAETNKPSSAEVKSN
jgi:hypothetical protein